MLYRELHLLQDILSNIVFLWLCFEDDKNKKNSLPFDFFHKVPKLFSLIVQKCFGLKEIFPSQKPQVHERGLVGLKDLLLIDLKKLECVGLEHPWVQSYSEKLERLKLEKCPLLQKIVSCAAPFINLRDLDVKLCV